MTARLGSRFRNEITDNPAIVEDLSFQLFGWCAHVCL